MKLAQLQKRASDGYGDGGTEEYFDPETGKHTPWHPGDSLAWFVAIEIEETFDPDADDDSQIATAAHALDNAMNELQRAIEGLYRKEKATTPS